MKGNVEKLNKRHIRPTAMRELVLKVLIEQKTAISLAELENQFGKADTKTLYRTLKAFGESKLIHSIDDGTGTGPFKYSYLRKLANAISSIYTLIFLLLNANKSITSPTFLIL